MSIDTEDALREFYPQQSEIVRLKTLPAIDEHIARFISLSPFLVIGSSHPDRGTDVSPRGDAPGFVQVIDPNTLDCSEVFLPKAFTPNGIGPSVNETFGISNPFAIPELVSFEIRNRWGGKMFATADVFGRWDGTFDGEDVNPGVYLWRIIFRCEGQEIEATGSVTVLR